MEPQYCSTEDWVYHYYCIQVRGERERETRIKDSPPAETNVSSVTGDCLELGLTSNKPMQQISAITQEYN